MMKPRLALTLGDPAGIGPEIVLKALAHPDVLKMPVNITVLGDASQVRSAYSSLAGHSSDPLPDPDSLNLLDLNTNYPILVGHGDAQSGAASFAYLQEAIERTLSGEFQGIVTAPIAKSAWKLAGHDYPGQTELLAARAGSDRFGMLFAGRSPHSGWMLRVLLATIHIPLRHVPQVLTPNLVDAKLELLWQSLQQDFGLSTARIAVAGINPHSGEMGQLGREEIDWLEPLLQTWQHKYPNLLIDGPVPPDTLWVKPARAWQDPGSVHLGHDAYLAMYHDQGTIPVKLLAFDRAVNTTIGLPFVRTSPDHGTAFDIAGKGIARPDSLIAALQLAAELVQRQQGSKSPGLFLARSTAG